MPWPRSERGSPVPKPKARSLILVPRQNRNERPWRKWQATHPLALALPPAAVTEAGCEPPTPIIADCVPCTCPTTVAACPMAVARAFDNAPRSDLGQGTWVRIRDLTRYLQGYLYIPRCIYISLGVFMYPPKYLYIPRGIYISRAVFINPQRYLYGIYKSPAVFIYPARYL